MTCARHRRARADQTLRPQVAVNGIDIAVPEGEVWGFLGPERLGQDDDHPHAVRTACAPTQARAPVSATTSARSPKQIKREVGYMTQKFSFWEDLSIRENLDFVARVYELPDARARGRRDASSAWA